MSTRRARIKAVAALPPRRKNQENADAKKVTESIEKALKSPTTPRSISGKSDEKKSPLRSPGLLPSKVTEKDPAPVTIPGEVANSPVSEKVPVITSHKSVFASPQARSSPDRRRTASPQVLSSPKAVTRSVTPQLTNATDNVITGPCKSTDKLGSTPTADKNDIPDDYSVPSVPDSAAEDAIMDGIVPLKPPSGKPKPLDLLKTDIHSDYAEVSFDPIVPLPSPSKVRPKLRPAPRLGPLRRNSIQGSASESEDESRRALLNINVPTPVPPRQRHDSHSTIHSMPAREVSRTRNDSISSSISQVAAQPPRATSPVKEKQFTKTRRSDVSRRWWTKRKEVKRDSLTMYDLIFYNPTTNPIIPNQDELNAKEANAKEEAMKNAKESSSEDEVDDPPEPAAPVAQVKLGPDGKIIVDESSLVIKQSSANRKLSVVREGTWAGSGGGHYSRSARTADWSDAETVRFYRALAALGTDFSLMQPLFPDRKRRDLYLKFKKEERSNGGQVDKALRTATAWDPATLLEEFQKEREDAARRFAEEKKKLQEKREEERLRIKASKETRIRPSRGAKALELRNGRQEMTAEDFARCASQMNASRESSPDSLPPKSFRKRRKKAPEFVAPTIPQKLPILPNSSPFATLTLIKGGTQAQNKASDIDMATLSKISGTLPNTPVSLNDVASSVKGFPSNIETGSLVVLRVNDPKSPTKTMLQTYIAHGSGKLTPVALPPTFLNSVVGYMKKGTPSTMSTASSPQILTSPSSVASQDSRSCTPNSVIQLNPSPKRKRHSSYTITQL